jgi:hypothetical protein
LIGLIGLIGLISSRMIWIDSGLQRGDQSRETYSPLVSKKAVWVMRFKDEQPDAQQHPQRCSRVLGW